jgi:hypothetical protein
MALLERALDRGGRGAGPVAGRDVARTALGGRWALNPRGGT